MLWITKFRKRKVQSIMIFLMIMICSLMMAGSINILSSMEKPYADLRAETNPPDLRVIPIIDGTLAGKDGAEALNELSSVKQVYTVKSHIYEGETVSVNGMIIDAFVSTDEYQAGLSDRVRQVEGDFSPLKEDECFIPTTLANDRNIKVGDEIAFRYSKEKFTYKVKGIVADAYSLNTSFNVSVLVKTLPSKFDGEVYYSVFTEDGKNGADVVEEYMQKNDGLLDGNFAPVEEVMSNASITAKIVGAMLLVLSIVFFLVTTVMIRYMIRNGLLQERKSIAIYKAIGYEDKDLEGIYAVFYQAIALIGSIIGVLASPIISNVFMKATYESLGLVSGFVSIASAIICIVVINVLVLTQVYLEIKKLRKIRPAEVFSGKNENLGIKKKKARGSLKFTPLAMALRMICRDRKNTVLIIITCFLSVFMVNMVVVAMGMMDGMSADNYYWLGFDKHDITGQSTGDLESFNQTCDKLENDPDVDMVVRRNLEVGFCIPYSQSVGGMIYETYDNIEVPVIEGRSPQKANEILIGNIYVSELGKDIGDYIDVYIDGTNKKSLLIVGTFQSFYNLGRGIKLHGDLFKENDIPMAYPECSIYLKEGVDHQAFLDRVNTEYVEGASFIARTDLFKSVMDTICEPQKAAFGPFAILALLIGCLNLIYIIYLKNNNERKTYAIYKSVGYPASHLVKMNCCYVAIIAIASILVAVPIFLLSFPSMMVLSMSMFGFAEYPVTFDPLAILIVNIIIIGIFVLGAIISSKGLLKDNYSDLISE